MYILFLLDLGFAVIVAALTVKIFTGEPVWGQFDYLVAAVAGIIIFAIGLALIGAPNLSIPPMFVLMGGGVLGCSGFHFYKEYF